MITSDIFVVLGFMAIERKNGMTAEEERILNEAIAASGYEGCYSGSCRAQ